MMKILFIEPPATLDWTPQSSLTVGGRRHPALSVSGEVVYKYQNLSAAAVLREEGEEVQYVHCEIDGISVEDLNARIESIKPDVLVIYIEHINFSVPLVILSRAKKNEKLKVINILVGPLATALGEKLVADERCDFVVFREYDISLKNLIKTLDEGGDLSKVKGIIYKDENSIVVKTPAHEFVEDLDTLPFPAYDLVDISKAWESIFLYHPTATVITSRGCPYKCVYCSFTQTIYSHKIRMQSPERVFEEARYLKKNFGIKAIRYDDDTFTVDHKRVHKICDLFIKEKLNLKWFIQTHPKLISSELVSHLRRAGCYMVHFGMESACNDVLKAIKKGATIEEMVYGFYIAQKGGLEILNSFMVGFLWDNKETIEKTIRLAYKLNSEFVQFTVPIPLPGTEYYEILKDKNYFRSNKWEDFSSYHSINMDFPELSSEYINSRTRNAYKCYYIRPSYLFMMLRKALTSPWKIKRFYRLTKGWLKKKKLRLI
ncbi:MAG: radical SAM protein [Candidatus Omnitrophota bacterium]